MNALEQHHNLALMLFVGRSLSDGLPWSVKEDRHLIHKERVLWATLTPAEQETEQLVLLDLWERGGDGRVIQANPDWGDWAADLGEVIIPDEAFGGAQNDLRPEILGPPDPEDYPGFAEIVQWLFRYGFRVTQLTFGIAAHYRQSRLGVLHMPIPNHRINKEADRLFGLLVREFHHLKFVPREWVEEGVAIWTSYDAVMGTTYLFLQGINDAEIQRSGER